MTTANVTVTPWQPVVTPYHGPIAFNPWHVYTSMIWVDEVTLLLSATGPIKGKGTLRDPVFSLRIAASVFGGGGAFKSDAYPTQFGAGLAAIAGSLACNATVPA